MILDLTIHPGVNIRLVASSIHMSDAGVVGLRAIAPESPALAHAWKPVVDAAERLAMSKPAGSC